MDSANQVIVAARATNLTSDKQQAVTMMEETIDERTLARTCRLTDNCRHPLESQVKITKSSYILR